MLEPDDICDSKAIPFICECDGKGIPFERGPVTFFVCAECGGKKEKQEDEIL